LIYWDFLHCNNAKDEFGQAHCKDILNWILRKFISYFYELYCIFYVF
jgi:hypothetical protein